MCRPLRSAGGSGLGQERPRTRHAGQPTTTSAGSARPAGLLHHARVADLTHPPAGAGPRLPAARITSTFTRAGAGVIAAAPGPPIGSARHRPWRVRLCRSGRWPRGPSPNASRSDFGASHLRADAACRPLTPKRRRSAARTSAPSGHHRARCVVLAYRRSSAILSAELLRAAEDSAEAAGPRSSCPGSNRLESRMRPRDPRAHVSRADPSATPRIPLASGRRPRHGRRRVSRERRLPSAGLAAGRRPYVSPDGKR
jgi:hypothetical protein